METKAQPAANATPLSVLTGILRFRWQIWQPLWSGAAWHIYRVQDTRNQAEAFLVQRSFSGAPAELGKWKRNFEQYCAERGRRDNVLQPAVLDRFTDDDSLYFVESFPAQDWTSLKTGPPPDPAAWLHSFFKGLATIGGHGNPALETVYWKGTDVLFSCSSLPSLNGSAEANDKPEWLVQVAESAFRQNLAFILKREDLNDELRSRLEQLVPVLAASPLRTVIQKPKPDQTVQTSQNSSVLEAEQRAVPIKPTVTQKAGPSKPSVQPLQHSSVPEAEQRAVSTPNANSGAVIGGPKKALALRFGVVAALLLLLGVTLSALWFGGRQSNGNARENTPHAPALPPSISSSPLPSSSPDNTAVRHQTSPVRIQYFTITPQDVATGEPVVLSWKVNDASSVRIVGLPGGPQRVKDSDTMKITLPPDTKLIVLEAEGIGRNNTTSALRNVHIIESQTVGNPPSAGPQITEFKVVPTSIGPCGAWLVRWTVNGPASVAIESDNGTRQMSAGYTVLTRPGRYTLRASDSSGTTTHDFTITASHETKVCNEFKF